MIRGFDEESGEMLPDVDHATATIAAIRDEAARMGRTIGVFSRADIWCRPTQREAYDYYQECAVRHADWAAVQNQLRVFGHKDDGSPEFERLQRNFVRGFPIIGPPDRVAATLAQLSALGCDGLGLSFLNYVDDFPYFRDHVLPRLEKAGLRRPVAG
jgi:alkanesulfonate monooxygenase SsuD/methylene tetrahydromethanopterin reductase-like flavin-dependent oxidoreductase (luciferase family)